MALNKEENHTDETDQNEPKRIRLENRNETPNTLPKTLPTLPTALHLPSTLPSRSIQSTFSTKSLKSPDVTQCVTTRLHHHSCHLSSSKQNLLPMHRLTCSLSQLPLSSSNLSTTPLTTLPTTCPLIPTPSITKRIKLARSCKFVRKHRRSRVHRVKKQEYKKLRAMVPALQEKNKVSKVVVIEEAIKYIDELHSALVQRFKARSVPTTFNGVQLDPHSVDRSNIRDLIRRLLANANPTSLPPARIENVRTLPSFLHKMTRHKKGS